MYDVQQFQNANLKMLVVNMAQVYSEYFSKELNENLDILNYILSQKLDYLLNNFLEFKYLLKSQQVSTYLHTMYVVILSSELHVQTMPL